MSKAYNIEMIKNEISKIGYTLLSNEYKNNRTKLKIKCDKGHIYTTTWNQFQQGTRCKICANERNGKKRRLNIQCVIDKINDLGFEYISGEYKNNQSKLKIKCKNGHIFETCYAHIQQGGGCKKCSYDKMREDRKFTNEDVNKRLNELGYTWISGEYKGNRSILKVKCSQGHIRRVRFCDLKEGQKCSRCHQEERSKNMTLSYSYVKKYIESMGFKLLSDEYINENTQLKIQCSNGHIFYKTLVAFKITPRCPECESIQSKGENIIINNLVDMNIDFISQYKFKDCKFKRPLPFDFYLPDYNICIEYDGEQHYKIGGFNGTLWDFVDIKIRDTIKSIYCENNNIKLIRIPYWEINNIETILKNELI